MGRGKEKLETCCACGAKVPRNKAVYFYKRVAYGTELRGEEKDLDNPYSDSALYTRKQVYCVSCGKHRGIYEKKKKAAAARREKKF